MYIFILLPSRAVWMLSVVISGKPVRYHDDAAPSTPIVGEGTCAQGVGSGGVN